MAQPVEILVFELANHRFGLPATEVQELVRAVALTPLPQAPQPFEGVINWRGKVVPVLDLRRSFGLPIKEIEVSDHLIVVQRGEQLAALRVDRAVELSSLEMLPVRWHERERSGDAVVRVANSPLGLVLVPDVRAIAAGADLSRDLAEMSRHVLPSA